jgi:carbon-monoxide dehydrogenase medium subunit
MLCGIATLDTAGRVDTIRLAAGSVAPVPVRLPGAEAAARGKNPREAASLVQAAASAEVVPIDDIRSNAEYRKEVTGRLAARFVASL